MSCVLIYFFQALCTWCCRLAARLALARPPLRLVLVLAPLLQLHFSYTEEMRMYLTRQLLSQERRLRSMALRILHAGQVPRDILTEATHAPRLLSS
jgi:hypothetical protein